MIRVASSSFMQTALAFWVHNSFSSRQDPLYHLDAVPALATTPAGDHFSGTPPLRKY
jgi:hypothetical protein